MDLINVLILGSGGREHAFAYYVSQSKNLQNLWIAPGNAGTSKCGKNINIAVTQFDSIADFLAENSVDLLIVGPEQPLVKGIRAFLEADERLTALKILGPGKEGAQLEGSKSFSKRFMQRHNIPTAAYFEVDENSLNEGLAFIDKQNPPIVLKADGLAAGKGVLIIEDKAEAKQELKKMLDGKFGEASSKVVIEEFLDGIEFSVFVLTDGNSYKILPTAKDYKRIGEGDTGLNTGGMGAISPVPFVDVALMKSVEDDIIKPTIDGLKNETIDYCGFIYFGLIKTAKGVKVIEYNARLGDPETQAVLPRIKSDLLSLLFATANRQLANSTLEISEQNCATVVCVSEGYPQAYEKGKTIEGLNDIENGIVFHAGTISENDVVKTNGGRVLAVTNLGEELPSALKNSYADINKLCYAGITYRKDIGFEFV